MFCLIMKKKLYLFIFLFFYFYKLNYCLYKNSINIEILKKKKIKINSEKIEVKNSNNILLFITNKLILKAKENGIKLNNNKTKLKTIYIKSKKIIKLNKKKEYNNITIYLINKKNKEKKIIAITKIPQNYYLLNNVTEEIMEYCPKKAIKSQTIISFTFSIYRKIKNKNKIYDIKKKKIDQKYKFKDNIKYKTKKIIKKQNNKIIINKKKKILVTYYHSMCYGLLSTLKKKKCKYCLNTNNKYSYWKKKIKINQILKKKNIKKLILNNKKIILLLFKKKKIKSLNIKKIININNKLFIYGKGFGHNIGLCQHGLIEMSKKKINEKNILKFYFGKIKIKKIKNRF